MRRGTAVLVLIALGPAGCGAASLSTQQLRSQAAGLCRTARRQTDRITPPSSPAGGAAFLSDGITVLAPELGRLRALHPPRDLAQVYSTAVNAFSQKLSVLRSTASALAGGSDAVIGMKTLQQGLAPLEAEEDGAWRALGIPACVNR